jgi:5'-3' exonuclease
MFLGSYPLAEHPDDTSGPQVDEEMVEAVGRYVDTVWALSQGNELLGRAACRLLSHRGR